MVFTVHKYGKAPFLMGKSTISMVIFNSKLLVYQGVNLGHFEKDGDEWPLAIGVYRGNYM